MSTNNSPPIVMTGLQITGGVQILNYNTFTPPAPSTYSYILDDMDNVLTTEDQQYGFVTE
jgi:hypothetical protein